MGWKKPVASGWDGKEWAEMRFCWFAFLIISCISGGSCGQWKAGIGRRGLYGGYNIFSLSPSPRRTDSDFSHGVYSGIFFFFNCTHSCLNMSYKISSFFPLHITKSKEQWFLRIQGNVKGCLPKKKTGNLSEERRVILVTYFLCTNWTRK